VLIIIFKPAFLPVSAHCFRDRRAPSEFDTWLRLAHLKTLIFEHDPSRE
jgi:hypothetical protein